MPVNARILTLLGFYIFLTSCLRPSAEKAAELVAPQLTEGKLRKWLRLQLRGAVLLHFKKEIYRNRESKKHNEGNWIITSSRTLQRKTSTILTSFPGFLFRDQCPSNIPVTGDWKSTFLQNLQNTGSSNASPPHSWEKQVFAH